MVPKHRRQHSHGIAAEPVLGLGVEGMRILGHVKPIEAMCRPAVLYCSCKPKEARGGHGGDAREDSEPVAQQVQAHEQRGDEVKLHVVGEVPKGGRREEGQRERKKGRE